jgi:hypothetical protein
MLVAMSLGAATGDVLARVDGVTIDADTFARRVDAIRAEGRRVMPERVLDVLVNEALLASEARRLGLSGSAAVFATIKARTRRAAADVFVEKQVAAQAPPSDAALREMFHATSDFVMYESITFETSAAARDALKRIQGGSTLAAESGSAVVSQIHANPATAPAAMRAQLEASLAEALFAAAPGAVVGPVPLRAGFAIARVLDKEIGTEADFAARRDALLAHSKKQLAAQARTQFRTHLRENAHIDLDLKFLEGLRGLEATPAQLDHVIATVNGRPVRYGDIYDTIRLVGGATGHVAGASVKIQLAWREIENRLLDDLAVARGYDKEPDVVARQPEIERAALAMAAVEHLASTAPPPTDGQVKDFYRRNAAAYGRPLKKVRADVVARAAEERKAAAVSERVAALRAKASVWIDRGALARAAQLST